MSYDVYTEVLNCGASDVSQIDRLKKDFRLWREQKGLTQEDAAKLIGVNKASISEFENKPRLPRYETLDRVMEIVEDWRSSVAEAPAEYGTLAMVKCPQCGELTPGPDEGMSFCGHCGEALGYQCPQCGTLETRPDSMFCRVCGHKHGTPLDEQPRPRKIDEIISDDVEKSRRRRKRKEPEM